MSAIRKYQLSVLTVLTMMSNTLLGQDFFDPRTELSQLNYTNWTTREGLSSSNTTDVEPDHHGLLWITSFNGLMTFDAERIELFDKNNTPEIETDGLLTVSQSPNLDMYFGTQGSGLLRYRKGKMESITSDHVTIPKSIRTVWIDHSETVYFSGQNAGLFVLQEDSVFKYPGSMLDQLTIISIKKDADSSIWVGTEGKGIFKINPDTIINYNINHGLASNYVSDIHLSDDGIVTFATPRGLQQIEPNGEIKTIKELEGIYINVLLFDSWNTIWLGGEAGLYRYHLENEKLEKLESYRGIDFVRISSITKDNQGNIWMTSSRSGLINIRESLVKNISEPNLSSNRANIIHESLSGIIYIGTDQNHLEAWDGEKVDIIPIKTNLRGNGIRGIWDELDGTIWLATYAGVIKIKNGSETVYNTNSGMPANTFRVIIKGQDGSFWMGTRSGGLVRFKNDEIINVYDLDNGLFSNFILALAESADGSIYVGTNAGGMTVISTDGETKTYNVREDDSGILIFNIDIIDEENIILTTNIGPCHFDGKQIRTVHLDTNGQSSTYFDVVWDQKEHIWLTTNIGILKIQKSDWRDFLEGNIERVPYVIIDEMSGMTNRECTGATKSTMDSNGLLYFPTFGGVCIIDPRRQEKQSDESAILIRNVWIDDKKVEQPGSKIIIPAGSNRIEFDYSLISFQTIGQNRYRYQLENFDEDISSMTPNSSVSYTNLPPGQYSFRVIGSKDGQTWSSYPARINLEVKPFFFETIWFYAIVLFVFLTILFLIYRWRLSFINRQNIKLKKVNAELDRFVYSASHELRSPLTSVMGIIQLAKEVPGDISEYLGHIERSIVRLDNFIKDIIDYSRNTRLEIVNEVVDFDQMIAGILQDISYTDHFSKIECKIENELVQPFSSDPKRLKIAITNLINNAFKHHAPDDVNKPYVRISIRSSDNGIIIQIEDNGPGIEEKYQKDIFKMFYRATVRTEGSGLGLYIVHEIVERLRGIIELSSKPGMGTTFTLYIPNSSREI